MESLNAALASARPGDTVTVPVGVHPGPFRISGVTLVAEAPGATLLGPIVLLSGTLDGLTLKGAPAARPSTAGSQRRPQTRASLVDIPSGSSTLVGCRIHGTVRVGPGSAAQIRRNHISSAVGAGIELNGTAEGCEVSENTIEARGGAGIAVRRHARALLSSNRVLCSGGAGIEVAARAAAKVIQNTVHDGCGQGVLVHDGASAELLDNDIRRNFSSAVELSGEGTSAVLSGNTLRDGQSGVGLLIHRRAHAVATDNDIGGHPIANVEVGEGSAPTLERNVLEGSRGVGLLLATLLLPLPLTLTLPLPLPLALTLPLPLPLPLPLSRCGPAARAGRGGHLPAQHGAPQRACGDRVLQCRARGSAARLQ